MMNRTSGNGGLVLRCEMCKRKCDVQRGESVMNEWDAKYDVV